MGGIFGGSKSVKAPPVAATPPIPTVPEETEEEARKKVRRGRRETFITGELVPEETGKKKVLG